MIWERLRAQVTILRKTADAIEAMIPHEEDVVLDGVETVSDADIVEAGIVARPPMPAKDFFAEITDAIDKVLRAK